MKNSITITDKITVGNDIIRDVEIKFMAKVSYSLREEDIKTAFINFLTRTLIKDEKFEKHKYCISSYATKFAKNENIIGDFLFMISNSISNVEDMSVANDILKNIDKLNILSSNCQLWRNMRNAFLDFIEDSKLDDIVVEQKKAKELFNEMTDEQKKHMRTLLTSQGY